jgi:hypothetical protein
LAPFARCSSTVAPPPEKAYLLICRKQPGTQRISAQPTPQ